MCTHCQHKQKCSSRCAWCPSPAVAVSAVETSSVLVCQFVVAIADLCLVSVECSARFHSTKHKALTSATSHNTTITTYTTKTTALLAHTTTSLSQRQRLSQRSIRLDVASPRCTIAGSEGAADIGQAHLYSLGDVTIVSSFVRCGYNTFTSTLRYWSAHSSHPLLHLHVSSARIRIKHYRHAPHRPFLPYRRGILCCALLAHCPPLCLSPFLCWFS